MPRKSDYNYGFALLKIWMCFEVVLCHFDNGFPYGAGGPTVFEALWLPFKQGRFIAAPCFMILSFYLTANALERCSEDWKILVKRVHRLLLPHIVWAIAYFLWYFLIALGAHKSVVGVVKDLVLQLLFGHSLNATMWFQVILIALTLMYVLLLRLLGKNSMIWVAGILLLAAFAAQYTGVNEMAFHRFPVYMSYTLGRLCESIPYASIGLLAAKCNLLKKRNYGIVVALILYLMFLLTYDDTHQISGFNYQGIPLFVGACSLVYIFSQVSLDWLAAFSQNVVVQLASVTMGVYCMHRLVGKILQGMIAFDEPAMGMISSIIIYALSMVTAVALSKVPIKWLKNSLQ